jgi:hypothetical protein
MDTSLVLNTKTGRYVLMNGRIGKRIMSENSERAKREVLCLEHIRTLVKSYLVFEFYKDYISDKTSEFLFLFRNTKGIDKFYKKTLVYVNLNTTISFGEIQHYYFTFLMRNIRYNLFNNSDELIKKNKQFCLQMNKILKKKKLIYRLPLFNRYINALKNSIHFESTKHKESLKKYKRDFFHIRPFVKYITYYW